MPIVESDKIKGLANLLTAIYAPGIHIGGGPEHNLESILFRRLLGDYKMMGINVAESSPSKHNPGIKHKNTTPLTSLTHNIYEQRINNFNSINTLEIVKKDQVFSNNPTKVAPQTQKEQDLFPDDKVKISSDLTTKEFTALRSKNTNWYLKQLDELNNQKDRKLIATDKYFETLEKLSEQYSKNSRVLAEVRTSKDSKKGEVNFKPLIQPRTKETHAAVNPTAAKAQNPFQPFKDLENQNIIEKSEEINKLQEWFRKERAKLSPTEKPELYFTKANLVKYDKNLEPVKREFQERYKAIQDKFNSNKLSGINMPSTSYTFPFRATPTSQLFTLATTVNNNAIKRFGEPVELIRRSNGEFHTIFINPENGERVAVPASQPTPIFN